ncbi:MAG: hypothetical protein JNL83_33785 [Myxococcales bacterium]|nr:hypothetical protein [Myxococcales bacterium]
MSRSRLFASLALVCSLATSSLASAPQFARPPVQADRVAVTMPARTLDRATVRAKLLERRKQNLERFRAYQAKGMFPQNTYVKGSLNVWIDEAGNLCAAATIINADGHAELVKIVGSRANFIKLADVTQGPLMDWMLTSGFTKEEIVAIQAPMVFTGDEQRWLEEQNRIDEQLRLAETARLKKVYKGVERSIVKNEKRSLEVAVDRLMANPSLAWKLIDA